ncbi:tyrosine-type recombinase/integrase [Devosia sp. SL43]|uniref:tyrosine-type recombinase/integrase n=1 Tax=Devosia sp. SL43 TaxID=2806348 RepID=UPI001F29302A|nr:site-specific integrase [Devosia sp. SL43]UJW83993.1 integrase arm-type DNA-binding domain-containing protein [Devosia sp. SL43]
MGRGLNRLTSLQIRNALAGKYADGGGLWLHKREAGPNGAGQWFFRYTLHGRRREMGLGSVDVPLREAREAATKWRVKVREGIDPIHDRQRQKREAARNLHKLKDIATDAFESRKADLKDEGIAGRWFSPLELHVLPKLGDTPVGEIEQIAIRDALAPIWHTKADTARKSLNRLAICLRHAAALGLDVDLQATEKARALLGTQRHVAQNIPAMHWQDVPAFYATLNECTITHLALRLTILTAARSMPLRFLHEDQVVGDIWTIPGEAMKGRKGATVDFRIPLSAEALAVVSQARRLARNGYLFPSARKGVISDATMARHMERAGLEARPHGFRSSLRDWLAETTNAAHEVAEMVLSHKVGGSVERAYRRTDFIEQRRTLMERWARFVTGQNAGNVISLVKEVSTVGS